MDYNWLENTPQVSQGWKGAMPIWQPDYSFLQSLDMRINQQFDQGVSKIANSYSLFNQPVIGDKAREVQQTYARQAQDKLKDLSSADLSDPKNVQAAENIMAPFYTDQNLLSNISYAKYYDSQDSKLDSWQNSTDKDIRAQYNDEMRAALQYKRREYAEAPFDKEAYNNIERMAATPYFDINADIDKAYKDEQNKGVDNVSIMGARMTTEHNGVKSLDAFRNYYLSKVGDKYNGQLRVHAYVSAQRYKQQLMMHNPGMTQVEADKVFAQENVESLTNSYKTNRDSYNKLADYWESRAQEILKNTNNGKTAGQDQLEKVGAFREQAQAHRNEAIKYDSKFQEMGSGDPNSPNYQKFFKELYEHPEQYIADIDKQIKADNWAKGMAYMNTSAKVELDPVTEAYMKHQEKNAELRIQQNQVNATLRGQAYNLYKETGTTTPGGPVDPRWNKEGTGFGRFSPTELNAGKDGTGKGGLNPDGTPNNNAWIPLGINTTDVAHLSSDIIKKQQALTASGINNSIFDPQTGLSTSLKVMGVLSQNELIDFNNVVAKMSLGDKLTPEHSALLDKVRTAMKDQGIDVSKANTLDGLQNAMISYTTKIAGDLRKTSVGDNLVQQHMLGSQLAATAGQLQQRMALYNKNQEEYNKKQNEVLASPTFDKIRITEPDGTNRMVEAGDVAKYLPKQITIQELGENGKKITLSGKDLGDAFLNNTLSFATGYDGGLTRYKGGADINYNGKAYLVTNIDGKSYEAPMRPNVHTLANPNLAGYFTSAKQLPPDSYISEQYSQAGKSALTRMFNPVYEKFGYSEDIVKLKEGVDKSIMKQLNVTKDGMITPRYGVDPSDEKTAALADRAGKEMGSVSVVPVIYNEKGEVASEDETKNLRQVLANNASMKNYVAQIYRTNTASGGDAYGVVMSEKATQGSTTDVALVPHSTYILPVSSLQNAPVLASIPQKTSFLYDEIYDPSKKLEAPPTIKAYGQNFIVRGVDPGADGKATAAYVMLYNSHPDPSGSGKTVDEPEKAYKIPMAGPLAKNSEEIMNFVYSRINAELNKSDSILSKIQQDKATEMEAQKYETAIQR